MLPGEKNNLVYLLNILDHTGKIQKYTEGIKDAEGLYELNEQLNLNASLTLLANIGENVSKLTNALKMEYSYIEWKYIKEFRNRVVHDYGGIDLAIVYEIITNDLRALKIEIENIIKTKIEEKIFDIEEIKISRESNYYKYVDFEKLIKALRNPKKRIKK
jgi:uncharacterized protein with HEPN domain